MKKILVLLTILMSALCAEAQDWYLHHTIANVGTANACDEAPDGVVWIGGTNILLIDPSTGQQVANPLPGGSVQGIAYSSGFMYYTRTSPQFLRRKLVQFPYTQSNTTGGAADSRHIAFTAGGDYIVVVQNGGWKKFSGAHVLLDENAANITWQSPKGVVIDEGAGIFKISDTGAGQIHEFSLATGDLISSQGAASPTGLYLYGGSLLVASEDGTITENAVTIVSDPTRSFNDVWRNDTILIAVTNAAVLVYKTYPAPVMPITLSSFEVEKMGTDGALVTAVTSTEINNQWMILETSRDGKVFKETSRQDGAGNSSAEKVYTFEVEGLGAGVNYFRLRQVDYDGATTTSDVRSLRIEGEDKFNVFPNPAAAGGWITVTLPEGAEAVVVFSLAGQWICEVTTGEVKLPSGDYVFRIREKQDSKRVVVR